MTQIERIIDIVNRELDAGNPFPKRREIAAMLGKPHNHDFGGRVTYELQKLKIARGIATVTDLIAVQSKVSTYESNLSTRAPARAIADWLTDTERERERREIVRELKASGAWS